MSRLWTRLWFALVIVSASCVYAGRALAQDAGFDWRSEWSVQDGFEVVIDCEGFTLPTAIAFVPEPGPGDKDPLYFVTELRGSIKVVTNDRTVHTFAETVFEISPLQEMPEKEGETGMAGLCLDPDTGYVFVTFTYRDTDGVLRNNIVRFDTPPGRFAIKPTGRTRFTDLLANDVAAISHQIGACQIQDDLLYVSIGDGKQPHLARDLRSSLGKVLRMTLDGKAPRDNPFYDDNPVVPITNYVWAYGLRNAFGLLMIDGRLYASENGPAVDRFLEIRGGVDHLWRGTDWSIGTNAPMVFTPSIGPVHIDRHPRGSELFPEVYRNAFFIATSGNPVERGRTRYGSKAILQLNFDLDTDRATEPAEEFLAYVGSGFQVLAGLAFGPDGLYFAPMLPNANGQSPMLKVRYDPRAEYPTRLRGTLAPHLLLAEKRCYACHTLAGHGGTVGPNLDRDDLVARLEERLFSDAYLKKLDQVDKIKEPMFAEQRDARQAVREASGSERLHTWVFHHLLEPMFDNPDSQMPNVGLTRRQADTLATYLVVSTVETGTLGSIRVWVDGFMPRPVRYRHLMIAFVLGLGAAAAVGLLGWLRLRRRHA